MKKKMFMTIGTVILLSSSFAGAAVKPGEDLQAILDKGEDLVLQMGAMYPISQTLQYKKPGQKIYTQDAKYPTVSCPPRDTFPRPRKNRRLGLSVGC